MNYEWTYYSLVGLRSEINYACKFKFPKWIYMSISSNNFFDDIGFYVDCFLINFNLWYYYVRSYKEIGSIERKFVCISLHISYFAKLIIYVAELIIFSIFYKILLLPSILLEITLFDSEYFFYSNRSNCFWIKKFEIILNYKEEEFLKIYKW